MDAALAGLATVLVAALVRSGLRAGARGRVVRRLGGPRAGRAVPGRRVGGGSAVAGIPDRLRSLAVGRAAQVDQQLPDAVEQLARSLRSGVPLRDAVLVAADVVRPPLADDLLVFARELEHGRALAAATSSWSARVDRSGATLAAAALRLGSESGGSRARALDRVARSLRERLGVQREVLALSAQARLSAIVMAVGPVAFAALTATIDQGSARVLLATPLGWACLGGALLLDAAAIVWMNRLVRGPQP